jgi:CubicO group peptidase (beta-lactamase class C family)
VNQSIAISITWCWVLLSRQSRVRRTNLHDREHPSTARHVAYGFCLFTHAGTLPIVHFYMPLMPTLLWLNRFYIEATPSTGLIGSTPDVAKFMIMYLNRGALNGEQLLSPESVCTLTEAPIFDGRGLVRGRIGWRMLPRTYGWRTWLCHQDAPLSRNRHRHPCEWQTWIVLVSPNC